MGATATNLLSTPVKHGPGDIALATRPQGLRLASTIQALVAQADVDPGWTAMLAAVADRHAGGGRGPHPLQGRAGQKRCGPRFSRA